MRTARADRQRGARAGETRYLIGKNKPRPIQAYFTQSHAGLMSLHADLTPASRPPHAGLVLPHADSSSSPRRSTILPMIPFFDQVAHGRSSSNSSMHRRRRP